MTIHLVLRLHSVLVQGDEAVPRERVRARETQLVPRFEVEQLEAVLA